jgi:uncharacterized phage protein (TIGR01671 family)
MREIKFRAWEKATQEMISDFLIESKDGECFGKYSQEAHPEWILMQFTGLKDKNEKEIYEGDIVKSSVRNLIVGFANGHFMIHGGNKPEDILTYNHEDLWKALGKISKFEKEENRVEIIGNIYENPELVK